MSDDTAQYITLASALIGLPIAPEHRAPVEQAFAGLMDHAKIVLAETLGERDEAAEVFTP